MTLLILLVVIFIIFCIFMAVFRTKRKQTINVSVTTSIERHTYTNEELSDLDRREFARWQSLADPALRLLRDSFIRCTDISNPAGMPLSEANREAEACIDLWYAYLDTQDGICTRLHAKDYLQQHFGPSYDPCLQSSEALRSRLASIAVLRSMGAVLRRSAENELIAAISSRGQVMRCSLVKIPFSGADQTQLRAVCDNLVRTGRLSQFKKNNRYYISAK